MHLFIFQWFTAGVLQIAVSAALPLIASYLTGSFNECNLMLWKLCWFSRYHVKLTMSNINPHLNLIKRSLPHNRKEADNLFLLELRCCWLNEICVFRMKCAFQFVCSAFEFRSTPRWAAKGVRNAHKARGIKTTWSETCCSGSQVFALSECPSCSMIRNTNDVNY